MKFNMRHLLFGFVVWLCVKEASCLLFKSKRIARQVKYPRSSSNDSCTTPSDRSGICVPVQQCRRLVEQKNVGVLRQSMCGFIGRAPKVCCPTGDDEEMLVAPEFKGYARDITLLTTQKTPIGTGTDTNATVSQPPRLYSNGTRTGARRAGKSPFPTECGRSQVTFRRIVGGQESVIGAWPWMAIIYYVRRSGASAECGGVLITKKHVITAAHCIVSSRRGTTMSPRQLRVRLGDYDIASDEDGATPVDVSIHSVIKYKSFDPRTFQNDLALLLLKSTIEFDKHVIPICLPFDAFIGENLANRNAFAAGWGTTSYGGPASSKLQEVQLRIWENPRCEVVFKREVPITGANLCAGDGDKDACRGDSGGPLMLASADGRFYLVGIVSFGKKCAEPGVPGVYTRVTNFLDWIESSVEDTM